MEKLRPSDGEQDENNENTSSNTPRDSGSQDQNNDSNESEQDKGSTNDQQDENVDENQGNENSGDDYIYYVPDNTTAGEGSILGETDSLNVSENVTLIPKEGHFSFVGQGNVDLSLVFNFNGTAVAVTGHIYIGPNKGTMEILWDTEQGYFEITGNGTFKVADFYFNANDQIICMAASLEISANGHVLLNQGGFDGELYLDGIVEVDGLYFDIDTHYGNFSIGGSLVFSGNTDAHNLYISWNDNGFSLDGSFNGNSNLNINDFCISTTQFSISTQLITFFSSTEFTFKETDGNVICAIVSNHLEITGISILYGNQSMVLDSVTVTGTLNILLHIDSGSYVSAEDGHISISGNVIMGVNTLIDINGTIIEIKGNFSVESAYDTIDIWWNKSKGYFYINCTSMLRVGGFYLSIDGSWLMLHWDTLIMNPGAYIKVDNGNGTRIMLGGEIVEIKDLELYTKIQNNTVYLGVASLHFELDGYVEAVVEEKETKLSANTVFGYSLTVQKLQLSVAGFMVSVGGVAIDGYWEMLSDGENISLTAMGSVKIAHLSARVLTDGEPKTLISAAFIYMIGEAEIEVGGGLLDGYVAAGGVVKIGATPVGPFSMAMIGYVHFIMDLETGVIHGEFGYNGVIGIGSIGVEFNGEGTFLVANDTLYISTGFSGRIHGSMSIGMSFYIDNLVITVIGRAYLQGYMGGVASATINLRTGNFSFRAAVGVLISVLVDINRIYIHGEYVTIDEYEWEDFDVPEDSPLYHISFHIDYIDVDIDGHTYATACVSAGVRITENGVHMGFGLGISLGVRSDMEWNIDIKNLEVSFVNETTDTFLHIDSIESEGNFSLQFTPMAGFGGRGYGATLYLNGTATINDIEFRSMKQSGNGTKWMNVLMDQISVDAEGGLEFLYSPIQQTDSSSSSLFALIINGTGSLDVVGLTTDMIFNGTDISASFGLFNFTCGGTIIVYDDGSTFRVEAVLIFTIENAVINIDDMDIDISFLNMSIEDIDFNLSEFDLEGYLVINRSEDGSTDYDFCGNVEFNTTFNISGKNFDCWGNITANGPVHVHITNDSTGMITYAEISADVEIEDLDICMGGTIVLFGSDVNWSFNLVNYSGSGLLQIKFDFINNSLYMANFQEDAHWDAFNFSVGWLLTANISYFYGDLEIDNFFISQDLLNYLTGNVNNSNLTAEIAAITTFFYSLFSGEVTIGDIFRGEDIWDGFLDPDNWTIHSQHGFETLLGFDFSSVYGTLLRGDVAAFYDIFHITQLYCTPGTRGRFEVSVDEYGNFLIELETTQGYANMVTCLKILNLTVWFRLDSDSERLYLGVGDIIRVFDDIADREWEELGNDLERIFTTEGFFEGLANAFVKGETGNYISLAKEFRDRLQYVLDTFGDAIPPELREIIEEVLQKVDEAIKNACFLAGTKIEIADGTIKNIEDIQVGDKVMSYDVLAGEWKVGVVTKVFHHCPEEMGDYYLVINNELRVTPNHPILVNGKWITAGELKVGDVWGGNLITSIERVYKKVPTYNIEVEPYHTYKVVWGISSARSIVHNAQQERPAIVVIDKYLSSPEETCFLHGTKVAVVEIHRVNSTSSSPNGRPSPDLGMDTFSHNYTINVEVKNIEDVEVGETILVCNPITYEVEPANVTRVYHHLPYQMISGYVEIEIEISPELQSFGRNSVHLVGTNVPTHLVVNVTPNHPLLVSEEPPSFTYLNTPSNGPSPVGGNRGEPPAHIPEYKFIPAGYVKPGLYTTGGKIVSVTYHPNAREDSYHLLLDSPYPYLIVPEGSASILKELVKRSIISGGREDDIFVMYRIPLSGFYFPVLPGSSTKNETENETKPNDGKDDDGDTCFLSGTKVQMANGTTKNIEDIQVGDKVMSYDVLAGEWKVGTVTKVFHHSPEEMGDYYLVINNELRATPNHPILVNGKWITAGELKVGDVFGGNVIVSIEKVYQRVSTYNLEVEPYHTYAVVWGKGVSIVHNKLGDGEGPSRPCSS